MRKLFTSKLKLSVVGLVLGLGAFFAINGVLSPAQAAHSTPLCDDNSVIRCGVKSLTDLRNKFASDYTKGTKNIFSHFGLNSTIINTYKVQEGVVYKNGDVKVGNKLVATGAHSAGRQLLPNSTKHVVNGTTFYTRPLSSSGPASWKVFVFFDKNDRYVGAVMLSCGNPVKAKPVEPQKPEPVYACASLSRIQKDRDTFTFRGKASVKNGAVLNGFTFNLGDGTTKYVAYKKHASDTTQYKYVDLEHTFKKAGTYTVKATAHFTANGKAVTKTSADCQKPVTIKEEPTPPAKKVAECVELKANRIGAKSFELNATARVAGGATISSYYFTVRNVPTSNPSADPIYFQQRVNTTAITAKVTTGEISALKAGQTYQATVTVTTSEGQKTNANCAVKITTKEEEKPKMTKACNTQTGVIEDVQVGKENTAPHTTDMTKCDDVKVCDPETGKIITVAKKDENKYLPVDSEKCKTQVCDPETGNIITVQKEDADKYLPVDDEACKEEEPEPPVENEVPVCDPATGKIITVKESEATKYLDKDSKECEDKPPVKGVVTELPKTGLAEQISGILGLGALTTAAYYYAVSRRNG